MSFSSIFLFVCLTVAVFTLVLIGQDVIGKDAGLVVIVVAVIAPFLVINK